MAISQGMDAVLVDPLDRDVMATIVAAEALVGIDEYCQAYVDSFRSGILGGR
jgi:5-methyltetrahydrofolate--homocysteine methyltransferase